MDKAIGNFIEKGSDLLDNVLEKQGYKAKNDIGKYVKFGSEYLYDTQKLPSERKKQATTICGQLFAYNTQIDIFLVGFLVYLRTIRK